MLGTSITISLIIGWFLGFISYFGFKIAYKEWMKVLEEEKSAKKEPLAYTGKVD